MTQIKEPTGSKVQKEPPKSNNGWDCSDLSDNALLLLAATSPCCRRYLFTGMTQEGTICFNTM